jgi:hypothetical protein
MSRLIHIYGKAQKLAVGGHFLKVRIRVTRAEKSCRESFALRKISNSFQQNMLEPIGLAEGYSLWVMQWLVLCGIPYSGSGALASPVRTNQLPTSLIGQATRPPGGSTAHLQLSKTNTRDFFIATCG